MKIVYYGYRDWSINIFSKIDLDTKYLVTTNDYSILESINPDLIFFIGWSSIVPSYIIEKYTCICLHPSDLPKYRGGSPIQNQIMDGVEDSKVSFFIMDKGIDTGDILYQHYLSLRGKLDNIFRDIEKIGIEYINRILNDYKNGILMRYKQDESLSSFCRRRKESESEININYILNNDPIHLYNKIRALNDPYPNAFIRCKGGKKLFLIESKYEK